jgi:hypothetical protein
MTLLHHDHDAPGIGGPGNGDEPERFEGDLIDFVPQQGGAPDQEQHWPGGEPVAGTPEAEAPGSTPPGPEVYTQTHAEEPQPEEQQVARSGILAWVRKHPKSAAVLGAGAAGAIALGVSPHTETVEGHAVPAPSASVPSVPGATPPAESANSGVPAVEGLIPSDKNLCNVVTFKDLNQWLRLGIPQSSLDKTQVECSDTPTNSRGTYIAYGEWRPDPQSAAGYYDTISITVDTDKAADGSSKFAMLKRDHPKSTPLEVNQYSALLMPDVGSTVVQVPDKEGHNTNISLHITPTEGIGSSQEVKDSIVYAEGLAMSDVIATVLPGVGR